MRFARPNEAGAPTDGALLGHPFEVPVGKGRTLDRRQPTIRFPPGPAACDEKYSRARGLTGRSPEMSLQERESVNDRAGR